MEKNCQPRILYPEKLSFRSEGEIKSFLDKQNLKEFITTTCLTRNVKGTSLSSNKRALISNRKTYESINLTNKGKYVVKLRII